MDKKQYIIDNFDYLISINEKLKENSEKSDLVNALFGSSYFVLFLLLSFLFFNIYSTFFKPELEHRDILLTIPCFLLSGLLLCLPNYFFKRNKLKNFKSNKISKNVYKKIFYYYYEENIYINTKENVNKFIESLTKKEIEVIENLDSISLNSNIKFNLIDYIYNLSDKEKIKNRKNIIKTLNHCEFNSQEYKDKVNDLKSFYLNNIENKENINILKTNIIKSI